jgi:hypothetical protein
MSEINEQNGQDGSEHPFSGFQLWWQWVLANAAGEAVGLGAASLIGVALAWTVERTLGADPEQSQRAFAGLAMMAVLVFAGTFEGTVVGVAQALVLRRWLKSLRWKRWVLATAAGALVAWTLGMLPSTLMDLSAEAAGAPAPEISDAMQYAFAVLLGAAAGPILGFAQWMVLRRHVHKAGWWLAANSAGWALGMPLVFVVAGSAPPEGITVGFALSVVLTIAAVGAVVGAVHGLALVWLLRRRVS